MGEEDLRAFLKAWLEWAETGGKHEGPFYRSESLCTSSYGWAVANDFSSSRRHELYADLVRALPRGYSYPFGGFTVFRAESLDGKIHLNPERLAWVRRQPCQKT